VPGAQGMEPVRFADVAIPVGTIDENLSSVFLPYLAWTPDARHTLNVLTAKGAVQPRTYAVSGVEDVTIAGASVAAFKVSVSGGEAPAVIWIEQAAPHRVLKIAPVGQPIEFVRVR